MNLGQTDLILKLDYRETLKDASSVRNKNDENKSLSDTRLEAPVQIYGSDFMRPFNEILRKR